MNLKQIIRTPRGALCAAVAGLALGLAQQPALAQAKPGAEPVRIGGLFSTTGGLAAVGLAERDL